MFFYRKSKLGFMLLNSHFLSAVVLPVASVLPPFHSPALWKGNFSSLPSLFFLRWMCAHMLHTPQLSLHHIQARFPSFHSKCTLASRRSLKIHLQSLLLAGFSVHFTSAWAVSAGTVTVQTLPPHSKSPSLSSAVLPCLPPQQFLAPPPELFRIQTQPAKFKPE